MPVGDTEFAKDKTFGYCSSHLGEWIEEKRDANMNNPVKKASDPADVVEINARLYKVTDFYIDQIIKNIKNDSQKLGLNA